MTRTAVHTCTDCGEPIAEPDVLFRSISSQLDPVPFHVDCYRLHVPVQRGPVEVVR